MTDLHQSPPSDVRPARRWWVIALGVIVLLSAAAPIVYMLLRPPAFDAALEECAVDRYFAAVADGGNTLVIDHRQGQDSSGVTTEEEACLLRELGVTTAVMQHMRETRALDGRQTDEWGGYEASWTYHPQEGLDITITR